MGILTNKRRILHVPIPTLPNRKQLLKGKKIVNFSDNNNSLQISQIAPPLIKDGVYYYDSQDAGDQFSLEEVVDTYNSGFFKKVFNNGRTIHREVFNILAKKVNEINKPYMEISCGPGLGLAPFIKNINP